MEYSKSTAESSIPSQFPPSPPGPEPETTQQQSPLNDPLTQDNLATIISNPDQREAMRKTLEGFKLLYFPHYCTLAPADFHPEFIQLLQDRTVQFLSVIGFRGCAKTSIGANMAPLYFALEKPEEYPFIILVADTTSQVKDLIADMRRELEENKLLINDYGDQSDGLAKQRDWTKTSLLLANGVRIMGLSRGQRIRGRKHRQHRVSLCIVDDPEEMEKVGKKEYRDKTERWLLGEVIPALEEAKARLMVFGNILHTDAIMMRIKNNPLFLHKDYSLFNGLDTWENCTWKAKYPDQAALDRQKAKVRYTAWMREYRLKVVPPDGQEVKEEWIQYYDEIPTPYVRRDDKGKVVLELNPITRVGVGEDLAISKKQTADYTTMVGGAVAEEIIVEADEARLNGMPCIYIMPNPVNERLSLHETLGRMKQVADSMRATVGIPTWYMEDVAYQRAAIEEAQRHGFPAIPVRVGSDKRSRLRAAAIFIQNGSVKFPRRGCEDLIAQLTGFGIEEHDDLCDALVNLVLGIRMDGMNNLDVIAL